MTALLTWRLTLLVVRNLLRIFGFMDFVHRPAFYKLENTAFRQLDVFPSSCEEGGGKTPTQLGPVERANLSH
jgi:hypothetical protein